MNIKILRAKKNVSQTDIEEATGIPRSRISNWENGRSKPKADDYIKLRDYFKDIATEEELHIANEEPEVYNTASKTTDNDILKELRTSLAKVNLSLTQSEMRDLGTVQLLHQALTGIQTLASKVDDIYKILDKISAGEQHILAKGKGK